MAFLDNLKKRINKNDSIYLSHTEPQQDSLSTLETRLNVRGGADQWVRMREDKLKSLKAALLYSYQRAIVQKYDVVKNSEANYIIRLITKMQDLAELNEAEFAFLNTLEQEYDITQTRGTTQYIEKLQEIVDTLVNTAPLFRCLINHDKLKVEYEDKIISIPFEQKPVGSSEVVQTNFHNGTVFKWVHGNKEEWTPDTYWIVYMQYSEETAYFRAEIRKADEEIEIITIGPDGQEQSHIYRGWMTGPNETTALWNVKKNVTWNDMNYTKLLYITKDQNTVAFFERFDRVIINGKPWEVQAYNESYTTSKTGNVDTGIIRVALKETYTGTDQFIKQELEAAAQAQEKQDQYDRTHTDARIDGKTEVFPYSICTFVAKNFGEGEYNWTLEDERGLAKIKSISQDGKTIKIQIVTGFASKEGFYLNYGQSQDTKIHVVIVSF